MHVCVCASLMPMRFLTASFPPAVCCPPLSPPSLSSDIYGPETAALVKLQLSLGEDEEGADRLYGKGANRRFVVNWRVPSWAESAGLKVSVNGKEQNDCTKGARLADAAEGELDFMYMKYVYEGGVCEGLWASG